MILNLEQQVCSLESAKRLKELGVRQDSLLYHYPDRVTRTPCIGNPSQCAAFGDWNDSFSAFNVAELGELLPPSVLTKYGHEDKEVYLYLICNRHPDIRKGFRCEYWPEYNEEARQWFNNGSYGSGFMELTEAEARAKMLIYLLENKLITLPGQKGE